MSGLLSRVQTIADYCGVKPRTIRRWRQKFGFPLYHKPSGIAFTSVSLIDQWLVEYEEERIRASPLGRRRNAPVRMSKLKVRLTRQVEHGEAEAQPAVVGEAPDRGIAVRPSAGHVLLAGQGTAREQ